MEEFKEETLVDMLPLYYGRIFPYSSFYKWLSYGSKEYFSCRELSFTLPSDVYIRYQSFNTRMDFVNEVQKQKPVKMDIGAVYSVRPNSRHMVSKMSATEKELVFDIDMTDYDEVRTCCSGAVICPKCWKFIQIACKVLDTALREDFGFKHLLWVFSGRRGVHCWVCDASARAFGDKEREAVVEYLSVIKGGAYNTKKVQLFGDIHSSIRRAVNIIMPYFTEVMLIDQDIIGTDERLKDFLLLIGDNANSEPFKSPLFEVSSSVERWQVFTELFPKLMQTGKLPKTCKNLVEEVILHYCYPRLDVNVTKLTNHLLKAPFCVHPKTGKISVPFCITLVDKFDPFNVPNLKGLVDEINAYDKKTKEQEDTQMDVEHITEVVVNESKIKDYKKTSLLKPVATFDKFISGVYEDLKAAAGGSQF